MCFWHKLISSQPRYDHFDTSAYMMQQFASYMQSSVRGGSRAQLLNPLRISHPKIDKLACQAQGADIFANGEITLNDANRTLLSFGCNSLHHIYAEPSEKRLNELRSLNPLRISHRSVSSLLANARCGYIHQR